MIWRLVSYGVVKNELPVLSRAVRTVNNRFHKHMSPHDFTQKEVIIGYTKQFPLLFSSRRCYRDQKKTPFE